MAACFLMLQHLNIDAHLVWILLLLLARLANEYAFEVIALVEEFLVGV